MKRTREEYGSGPNFFDFCFFDRFSGEWELGRRILDGTDKGGIGRRAHFRTILYPYLFVLRFDAPAAYRWGLAGGLPATWYQLTDWTRDASTAKCQ